MTKQGHLQQSVAAELAFDPLLDTSDIRVHHVMGVVSLSGTVPNYPQYVHAASAARRVSGVTKVHNHLEVVLPVSDRRDDAKLTTAANNALESAVSVPPGVEAKAKAGTLTLSGTVPFQSSRLAAESAVTNLYGVRNIKNDIEVFNDADPVDARIRVQAALDRHALVRDDSEVTVDTDHRTVTLTGHVRTLAEYDAVINAAWMTDGVAAVWDDLAVTG
jgi:osmotically-inducible protein OsmY